MPKLTVQEGYRLVGEYIVPEGESIIGRSADCDLVLSRQGVSRRHVRLVCEGNVVTAEDLGSRNGTFLNSSPITGPMVLKHLDVLQVGDTMLLYNELDRDQQEKTVAGLEGPDEASSPEYDLEYLVRIVTGVRENIARVVKGKDEVVLRLLVALLSDGHVLIEDVPGVGKTKLAQSLAKSIRADFKRVQFTPDMLPTDVTGVNVYDEQLKGFAFIPGPIFANIVLADEINRGTPRVQSSLLECMSESIVTVDGQAHVLRKPFFVIATQNPVEFHGTYPLPEAQLDRFLMRLRMGYPDGEVEREILGSQVQEHPINTISHVVSSTDILRCQALVRTVHVSDLVKEYIVVIAEATRRHPGLSYGCSPRASLALMRTGQALAAIHGRDYVLPRDVRDLAVDVLSHRLPLNLQARAEFSGSEEVVRQVLEGLPLERWEEDPRTRGA